LECAHRGGTDSLYSPEYAESTEGESKGQEQKDQHLLLKDQRDALEHSKQGKKTANFSGPVVPVPDLEVGIGKSCQGMYMKK